MLPVRSPNPVQRLTGALAWSRTTHHAQLAALAAASATPVPGNWIAGDTDLLWPKIFPSRDAIVATSEESHRALSNSSGVTIPSSRVVSCCRPPLDYHPTHPCFPQDLIPATFESHSQPRVITLTGNHHRCCRPRLYRRWVLPLPPPHRTHPAGLHHRISPHTRCTGAPRLGAASGCLQ